MPDPASRPAPAAASSHGGQGLFPSAVRVRRSQARAQRLTIIYGILCFLLILVIGQMWLLTATMNAFLGGDGRVSLPALGASAACLLLNLGLLRHLQ